jgi:hypothetical protein
LLFFNANFLLLFFRTIFFHPFLLKFFFLLFLLKEKVKKSSSEFPACVPTAGRDAELLLDRAFTLANSCLGNFTMINQLNVEVDGLTPARVGSSLSRSFGQTLNSQDLFFIPNSFGEVQAWHG